MTITNFQSELPAGVRRCLALGAHYAAAADEIRARGMDAALELVETFGGVTQRRSLAHSLIKAVSRVDCAAARRVRRHPFHDGAPREELVLEFLTVGWRYAGRRQVADVKYMPAKAVYLTPSPPRPLP